LRVFIFYTPRQKNTTQAGRGETFAVAWHTKPRISQVFPV
jgi:hypothetical protein